MTETVYLAGRYSRRLELCEYRTQLRSDGFDVQARWLDGEHQIDDAGIPIGEHGESLVEKDEHGDFIGDPERVRRLREKFADDDFSDAMNCDWLVAFTEEPRQLSRNRGGRHVELGIGLATGATVIVVGHRENIFCWLPRVNFFETWPEAREFMCRCTKQEARWSLRWSGRC